MLSDRQHCVIQYGRHLPNYEMGYQLQTIFNLILT